DRGALPSRAAAGAGLPFRIGPGMRSGSEKTPDPFSGRRGFAGVRPSSAADVSTSDSHSGRHGRAQRNGAAFPWRGTGSGSGSLSGPRANRDGLVARRRYPARLLHGGNQPGDTLVDLSAAGRRALVFARVL